jgi:hypothetical protein
MAQSLTQIQQAFDARMLTITGINTNNLFTENGGGINFALQPDITSKVAVRTTLVPSKTIVETMGSEGYVSVNGLYAVDVIGSTNQGIGIVAPLADLVLAAFPRGLNLTLTNGDTITVATSSPSPSHPNWSMNKLYCRQVIVEYFGYVQP